MNREDPLVLLGDNEFDLDFRKDKTSYLTLLFMSLLEPRQRELVYDFAASLYRFSVGKSECFLADGTWQGGDDGRN